MILSLFSVFCQLYCNSLVMRIRLWTGAFFMSMEAKLWLKL